MNRHLVMALVVLAAGVAASGCGHKKYSYPEHSSSATDGSYVSRVGKFKIGRQAYPAEFGTVTVSENRRNSNARLIHLPVIRIHARSSHPGEPVFGLAGGPGMSNMDWSPIDTLLAEHDFVMVGYRGVDGSTVLNCPEVAEALKREEDPLAEESLRRIGKAWEVSVNRLMAQGIDWDGYTMPQTVEDLEAVRRALRYPRIDLLSESYGTRLAYIYGLMHPESIHRSVMIGVNPPGHFVWEPQMVDEQLNHYSRLWSKDSILARESPDLAASMRQVLQNMPRKWLFFSISPGKVKIAAFGLLFQRNTAAMVFDALVAAEHGDASGIALMSLAYDFIIPSMSVWGDLASKAMSADFDSTRDYGAGPDRPETILGSPLSKVLWAPLRYGHVPVQMIPNELRTPQPSDVNTLLVSGSVDFSTPAAFATREMLPLLRNGRQIVLSEFGHVGDVRYLRQNRIESIIANYFDTGISDTSGIEYVPMDFHVGWGFPRIAKVAMGAILLLGVGLISGIVWISRKTL